MAKEFKVDITTGIVDSWDTLLTSTGSSVLIGLVVTSTINTGVTVDVRLMKQGGSWSYIGRSLPVPLGSSLQVVSGEKIVLEDGDSIEIQSSSSDTSGHDSGNVDATLSYMQNVNNPPV